MAVVETTTVVATKVVAAMAITTVTKEAVEVAGTKVVVAAAATEVAAAEDMEVERVATVSNGCLYVQLEIPDL